MSIEKTGVTQPTSFPALVGQKVCHISKRTEKILLIPLFFHYKLEGFWSGSELSIILKYDCLKCESAAFINPFKARLSLKVFLLCGRI